MLLPLTESQSSLWFLQRLDPTSPIFQMGACTEIRGALDPELMARAVRDMMLEVDALRARIVDTPDGPMQEIQSEPQWAMAFTDLRAEADPVGIAFTRMEADRGQPFDARAPLGANHLFQVGPEHFLWYRRAHHVLIDGYGSTISVRRVSEIYTALSGGEAPDRTFGPLRDLVEDDLAYQRSDAAEADREFWRRYMIGRAEPVSFVNTRVGVPRQPLRHSAVLGTEGVAALDRAAGRAGVTWPRLVIAVMGAYLHRLTGALDVTLGVPVAARPTKVARSVPGCVSNAIPLRCTVDPAVPLGEWAAHVSKELDLVLAHQRFRIERLRQELGHRPGERVFGPLINVMPFYEDLSFAGSPGQTQSIGKGPFQDILFAVVRHRGTRTLRIDLEADSSQYTMPDVDEHSARFGAMLSATDAALDTPIGALSVDIPQQRHTVAVDWNRVSDLSDEEVDRLLRELGE